jgi:hypothetical protein
VQPTRQGTPPSNAQAGDESGANPPVAKRGLKHGRLCTAGRASAGAVEMTTPRVNDKRTYPITGRAKAVLLRELCHRGSAQDPRRSAASASLPSRVIER